MTLIINTHVEPRLKKSTTILLLPIWVCMKCSSKTLRIILLLCHNRTTKSLFPTVLLDSYNPKGVTAACTPVTRCYFQLDDSSRTARIKITPSHTLSNSQHCYWFIVQVSVAYCKLTKVLEKLTATISAWKRILILLLGIQGPRTFPALSYI